MWRPKFQCGAEKKIHQDRSLHLTTPCTVGVHPVSRVRTCAPTRAKPSPLPCDHAKLRWLRWWPWCWRNHWFPWLAASPTQARACSLRSLAARSGCVKNSSLEIWTCKGFDSQLGLQPVDSSISFAQIGDRGKCSKEIHSYGTVLAINPRIREEENGGVKRVLVWHQR